jgi:hypothetical protein
MIITFDPLLLSPWQSLLKAKAHFSSRFAGVARVRSGKHEGALLGVTGISGVASSADGLPWTITNIEGVTGVGESSWLWQGLLLGAAAAEPEQVVVAGSAGIDLVSDGEAARLQLRSFASPVYVPPSATKPSFWSLAGPKLLTFAKPPRASDATLERVETAVDRYVLTGTSAAGRQCRAELKGGVKGRTVVLVTVEGDAKRGDNLILEARVDDPVTASCWVHAINQVAEQHQRRQTEAEQLLFGDMGVDSWAAQSRTLRGMRGSATPRAGAVADDDEGQTVEDTLMDDAVEANLATPASGVDGEAVFETDFDFDIGAIDDDLAILDEIVSAVPLDAPPPVNPLVARSKLGAIGRSMSAATPIVRKASVGPLLVEPLDEADFAAESPGEDEETRTLRLELQLTLRAAKSRGKRVAGASDEYNAFATALPAYWSDTVASDVFITRPELATMARLVLDLSATWVPPTPVVDDYPTLDARVTVAPAVDGRPIAVEADTDVDGVDGVPIDMGTGELDGVPLSQTQVLRLQPQKATEPATDDEEEERSLPDAPAAAASRFFLSRDFFLARFAVAPRSVGTRAFSSSTFSTSDRFTGFARKPAILRE